MIPVHFVQYQLIRTFDTRMICVNTAKDAHYEPGLRLAEIENYACSDHVVMKFFVLLVFAQQVHYKSF